MVAMDPNAEDDFERRILALLSTDATVGLTFAKIAAESHGDAEERERNLRNAKAAYTAIMEWVNKRKTLLDQHPEIAEKLDRLRTELQRLEGTNELQGIA